MNTINNVDQMARLTNLLTGLEFVSEFADGMMYNDPLMGEFNSDTPEVIISMEDDGFQIYNLLKANGYECQQHGATRWYGRCSGNGTNVDLHVKIAEDWELHHDAAKLTGLKFKLA